MKFYSLLFAFLSLTIIFYSCSDDEVSTPIVCENGFVSNGESCECPEGNVTAYNNCVELEDNQYYGITDNCPCNDTLIWTLFYDEAGENLREIWLNRNLTLPAAEQNRLRQVHFVYTTETPAGDSLYILGDGIEPNGILMPCNDLSEERELTVRFNGLLSSDENTISASFTYEDNGEPANIVGTCSVDFVKQ